MEWHFTHIEFINYNMLNSGMSEFALPVLAKADVQILEEFATPTNEPVASPSGPNRPLMKRFVLALMLLLIVPRQDLADRLR